MLMIDRILECKDFELESIFQVSKNLKRNEQDKIFLALLERAKELKCFDFICDKMSNFIEINKCITKNDNEILQLLLHANIQTNNHSENIRIFENVKIDYSYYMKNKLWNYFSYTYIELGEYGKALEILEKIKNENQKYYENYIDLLIKAKQYHKAEKLLSNHVPKNDQGKIWKSVTFANIFYESNNLEKLEIFAEKALTDFLKYRVSKEEIEHSTVYYHLGIFYDKLKNKKKSKLFLKIV